MSNYSDALYAHLQFDLAPYLGTHSFESQDWAPDASVTQVAAVSLLGSFYKKFVEEVSPEADQRAIESFLASNEKCSRWEYAPESSLDEILLGEFRRAVDDFLHPNGEPLVDSYYRVLDFAKTGPGASIGARGNDFYTKLFDSKLTSTSESLYFWYTSYIRGSNDWLAAEKHRAESHGPIELVEGERFGCVPKKSEISRGICTQPNLNGFFQLGMGTIIEMQLKRAFGIALDVQPDKNRELARIGSRDDSYVTIDLACASDSIACKMLEWCLPPWFRNMLWKLRCSATIMPDGSLRPLHMVSSMGNGFTFPLETMLFACSVVATMRSFGDQPEHPRGRSLGNYAVFGDDIIVGKKYYRRLVRLLGLLGFSVNETKSFSEGYFRESCGADCYKGQPVRGVYIKSLRTSQDRFVAINLLNEWSAKTGIKLPSTVEWLLKSVRKQFVPMYEALDSGIRVTKRIVEVFGKGKYPVSKEGHILYKLSCSTPTVIRVDFDKEKLKVSKGVKPRMYNSSGLYLAFLRGDITDSRISIRHGTRTRYHTSKKVCSNWNTFQPSWDPLVGGNPPTRDNSCVNRHLLGVVEANMWLALMEA